jgi:opacity protein-like surface antigen
MNSVNINWSLGFVVSTLVAMPLTTSAQVIYGLENAKHFSSRQSGPFFVQIGSFRSEHNAQQFKAKLVKKSHYPVQVMASGQYYIVRIGPLASVDAVRSLNTKQPHHTPYPTAPVEVKHSQPREHHAIKAYSVPTESIPTVTSYSPSHHWYVGMDAGWMQTTMGRGMMYADNGSNYPAPENHDLYTFKKFQPVMLDVQLGHRWNRDTPWLSAFALGLRYEHVFSKTNSGAVLQYSNPEFTNYSYHWDLGADVVSLYSKLDLVQYGRFMPYVDLGLGVSNVHSRSFHERAFPNVTPRISPDFGSSNNNQFAYNVGGGLDYQLNPNLLLTVGYDYQSFGNIYSGAAQGLNWNGTRLKLGKFNTNTGLIGFTYLFEGPMRSNMVGYK